MLSTSCAHKGHDPVLSPDDLVGEYGEFVGHIGWLELEPAGRYECFVTNGAFDGCLTVEGAGTSSGTWSLAGGVVSFSAVRERSDLVISLRGATAVPTADGLVVTVAGEQLVLAKRPSIH